MKVSEDYRQSVHVVPNSTSTRIRNAAVAGYDMMVSGLINLLLFLVSWGAKHSALGIDSLLPRPLVVEAQKEGAVLSNGFCCVSN